MSIEGSTTRARCLYAGCNKPCTGFAIVESAAAALRETAVPLRGGGPRRSRPRRCLVGSVAAGFLLAAVDAVEQRRPELVDVQRLSKKPPHLIHLRTAVVAAQCRRGDDEDPLQHLRRGALQLPQ